MSVVVTVGEWTILTYFIVLHLVYLGLNALAYLSVSRSAIRRFGETAPIDPDLLPPVTVVIPAYNEEAGVAQSVRSVLQLTYPQFEVLVVNDGSTDRTLAVLEEAFELEPYPEAYRDRIPTSEVRGFYASRAYPNLRVVDKVNGGKADAINVAINAARHPLFCTIDGDSILQRESLDRVVRPFLDDRRVIASGGTIRIANGCDVREGFVERVNLPDQRLLLFQVVEYLRAFLFGRVGWASFNGLLVLSGAFGMFHRETVVEAGGFRTDTLGEDMEVVVRLHRLMRQRGRRYRVAYVPDPICFSEAPDTLAGLGRQRVRWQRGLGEALALNRGLLFRGPVGWVSYPFHIVFELYGPLFEVAGYVLAAVAYATGTISGTTMVAFLFVSFGLGLAFSASALVLEELSFNVYSSGRDLRRLMGAAIAENFGYRQLNAFWRLQGLVRHVLGSEATWGEIERRGVGRAVE